MTDAEIIAELRQTVARHREERERLQTALDAANIPRQDIQLRIERLVCLNAAAPDLLAAAKAVLACWNPDPFKESRREVFKAEGDLARSVAKAEGAKVSP